MLFDEDLTTARFDEELLLLDEEAFALEELLLLFLTADEPLDEELLTLLPTATAPPREDEEPVPLTLVELPPPRMVLPATRVGLVADELLPPATTS